MTKSAVISIVGRPNAGKSTLLNRLIGHKISIVTPKVQTTRSMIKGIVTRDDTQFVFIDTPGIFEPKKTLEKAMVRCAWSSIIGADIVLLLLDVRDELDELQLQIIDRLKEQKINLVILLNKIDISDLKTALLKYQVTTLLPSVPVFLISAMNGDGVDNLVSFLESQSPEKPWYYDEDDITTLPMRFLASEITREHLFLELQDELPYNLTVDTETWEEFKDGSVKIRQVIIVSRASHKSIVLGKNGSMIKKIGQEARKQIKDCLGMETHLFLFVKVRENWDSDLCKSILSS
jgi:GTP-binding protein Era